MSYLIGLDLLNLDVEERQRIRYLTAELDRWLAPRYLWRVPDLPQGRRFLLMETQTFITVPDRFRVRIHVLDDNFQDVAVTTFSIGWRIRLNEARVVTPPQVGVPVVEVISGRLVGGRGVARQLYGLVNDQPILIRLEDSAGHVLRNRYYGPHHTIGPFHPKGSVAEYEEALRSENRLVVLEALNWLGGVHLDPARREPDVILESEEHLDLFFAAHRSEAIQVTLAQLAESPNPWIREAATLAKEIVLER